MKIQNTPCMFRCDHSCCKNFASKEIFLGGYKKSISLCSDHYLELLNLIKQDMKSDRQKLIEKTKNQIID